MCVSHHNLYRCQSQLPKWSSSMAQAGWKSLEGLLAACIYSADIQNELWEAGSRVLFPRQLIISKVNMCKKCSFSLVAPTLLTSQSTLGLTDWYSKEYHWKQGRKVALFCICMCSSNFWLQVSYHLPRGSGHIHRLLTPYARARTAVEVLQKTLKETCYWFLLHRITWDLLNCLGEVCNCLRGKNDS